MVMIFSICYWVDEFALRESDIGQNPTEAGQSRKHITFYP